MDLRIGDGLVDWSRIAFGLADWQWVADWQWIGGLAMNC